nr:hypothetical protein Iba_chr04fCG12100 [Ipomoea batatas]
MENISQKQSAISRICARLHRRSSFNPSAVRRLLCLRQRRPPPPSKQLQPLRRSPPPLPQSVASVLFETQILDLRVETEVLGQVIGIGLVSDFQRPSQALVTTGMHLFSTYQNPLKAFTDKGLGQDATASSLAGSVCNPFPEIICPKYSTWF